MTINDASGEPVDARAVWIEPEMIALNVVETTIYPRFGRDGSRFPDCQRS